MKKWIGLAVLCIGLIFGSYIDSDGAYRVKNNGQIIATPYASINTAVAAAGTNKETLVVESSDTLAANLAIPSTLTLKIPQGGMIVKASTYTLTINGPFEAGLYQVFSGFDPGDVTFGAGATAGLRPEWWGAKADNLYASAAANVTAFNIAAYSEGSNVVTLLLSSGVYIVTSTPGTVAIEAHCSIKGVSATASRIFNIGTGSAMTLSRTADGTYGSGRFLTYQDFSVYGNENSEDGIVVNTRTGPSHQFADAVFKNIRSRDNGRHGLVIRMGQVLSFTDSRFDFNEGLGVYIYSVQGDTYVGGATTRLSGANNGIKFINCSAVHNGGSGDATGNYLRGGIRISAGMNVSWIGGDLEFNNAWGAIIEASSGDPAYLSYSITIQGAYFEGSPYGSIGGVPMASTVGGCILADGAWENLSIRDNYFAYGSRAGQTGYGIYIKGDSNNYRTKIIEEGNHFINGNPAGTSIARHVEGIYPGKEIALMRISTMNIVDGTEAAHIKVNMTNTWNGDVVAYVDNIGKDAVDTGGFKLDAAGSTLTILESNMTLTVITILSAQILYNYSLTPISVAASKAGAASINLTFNNATTGVAVDLTTLVDAGSPIVLQISYLAGRYNGNYPTDF